MRIALIGGHGKVALELSPLLQRAGHEVRALVRNPEHEQDVTDAGATPVVADIEAMDTVAIAEVLAGSDAVVFAAGAGGGDPDRTSAVDRDAAVRAVDAAQQAGVSRFVMLSYFGAKPDHGVPPDNAFFAYAEAKATADAHLRESGLRWTIVAPSGLTLDAPTDHIEVDVPDGSVSGGQVSRSDVARVIAAVLGREDLDGTMIQFNNGEAPIDQALDRVAASR